MNVTIDGDRCCSSGQCVMSAPTVFDQREEDGVAFVLTDEVPEDQRDAVQRAADICPGAAISVSGDR